MGSEGRVTTGPIRWYGYLLQCRECDSTNSWTLSVEQTVNNDGEVAWLSCATGHRVRHPLIYPEIVHRVIGWATSPDPDQYGGPSSQELRDWLPHWTASEGSATTYRDWTQPSPVDWDREWPELVEAYKIIDRINAWQRETQHSDMSLVWMGSWGTTDPDVRHIEILQSRYRYADFHHV